MESIRMEEWRTPAISLVAAVIGGLIALLGQHWTSSRERDTKMVEIALGMLRAEPKEDALKAVRPWVIRVIEHHSGTQFYNEEREALLMGALPEPPPPPPPRAARDLREYPGGEFRSWGYR